MVSRWGQVVARRALLVVLAGVFVVIGAAAYGSGVFGSLSMGGFDDPESEASRQLALEQELFGDQSTDVAAIYSSPDLAVREPEFQAEVQSVLRGLPAGTTTRVLDYYSTGAEELIGKDGHATQVLVTLAGDTQDAKAENWEVLRPALESDELETHLAGAWSVYGDVNRISEEDLSKAEAFSLPVVLLLSLLIFGSLTAASMPVLVGIVAVFGALAVIRLLTLFTDVSVFSVNIITLIGMGLAIDYALFIISRFREELGKLPEDDPNASATAVRATMSTAGRTVLFSGLTVAAAMSSLLVFPLAFLKSIGYGGIAAVVVAMLAALTILPAVLRLLGRRIDAGRIPRRKRAAHATGEGDRWARVAAAVMRRPVRYAVAITGVLLAVGSPFLGVSWGSVDYRVLPDTAPSHIAAETLNEQFGPEQSSANLLLTGASPAEVADYTAAVSEVDGVVAVEPVAQRDDNALLRAYWDGNSQSEESQGLVRALREVPAPGGAEVLVGGLTAYTVDLLGSIGSHLPVMAVIVVAVMLVLLFLAFGSVVLPVKAVLMNALSITASFGVVTWIFAEGHLEGLFGFESTGYLDATQPILMLAILFGLSMDYEVFLLSRVREQWDRTGDNTESVRIGVQKTGRIITSAALLLAIVIGAFGSSGIIFMKMIGVGMLVALLVDATVIRGMLVPATMKLLGNWNWWAPGPMRRWWERYGFREGEEAPTPSVEPPHEDKVLASA